MKSGRALRRRAIAGRVLVFALCGLPLGYLVAAGIGGRLGPNPAEKLTLETGIWALRLLLVALAATPARRFLRSTWLLRHRRMIGLWAFAYAILHLLTYLWLDQFFHWGDIWQDLWERPFITAGAAAAACLVPMALTSWNGAVRRLGWLRWQRLHRLAYPAAGLAILHFWWKVKLDVLEPSVYAALFAALMLLRWPSHYLDQRGGVFRRPRAETRWRRGD